MFDLASGELRVMRRLNRPWKIQDFLEELPMNFENTQRSPRLILRERRAHCFEGALFGAAALWCQGERPLLLDLRSIRRDDDHVVALFQWRGRWGAISKTNHAQLRYRDPVYRTIRELAISYMNEYFLDDGRKTLREYSRPFDLARPRFHGWITTESDLRWLADELDASPHRPIITTIQAHVLRRADSIEILAGKLIQWRPTRRKQH